MLIGGTMKINKWILIGLGVFVLVALISVIYSYLGVFKKPETIVQTEYIVAPEFKKAKNITKHQVPIKARQMEVLDKTEVVKKVRGIPDEIIKNPNKEIVATAEIQPHEGKTSVLAITNVEIGKTELIAKKEPLPFMDLKSKFQIGLSYYPIHSTNMGEYALDANLKFIRIWKFNGAIKGEIDNQKNWKAGIRVYCEF